MKSVAIFLIAAAACGGAKPTGPTGAPPADDPAAPGYPATQWIPEHATFAVSAPNVRDARGAMVGVIDTIGPLFGGDAKTVGPALARILGADPFDLDQIAALGIDLDGGIAVFSTDLDPTIAIHLADPDKFRAFIATHLVGGMVASTDKQSGVVITSVALGRGITGSVAIDRDWLWVHFAGPHGDPAWFTSSHDRHPAGWADAWRWAAQAAKASRVLGFIDPHGVLALVASRAPAALDCAKQLGAVSHVAFAVDGDVHSPSARITFDLAPAAVAALGHAVVPPPAGWDRATGPLAVQWNVDLEAAAGWLGNCASAGGLELAPLLHFHVRTARAVMQSIDHSGNATGVVNADLSSASTLDELISDQLKRVPSFLRSRIDKPRAFGPYAGHQLSIPTLPTVDYVLTDAIAFVAIGDGLLDRIAIAGPAAASPPLFALAIEPGKLDADSWRAALELLDIHLPPAAIAALRALAAVHLTATLGSDRVVVEATVTRP